MRRAKLADPHTGQPEGYAFWFHCIANDRCPRAVIEHIDSGALSTLPLDQVELEPIYIEDEATSDREAFSRTGE